MSAPRRRISGRSVDRPANDDESRGLVTDTTAPVRRAAAPHIDHYRRPGEHIVYLVWDHTDERCIYIGVTSNFQRRMWQHASTALWWPFAARVSTYRSSTRDEADEMEAYEIATSRPPYNNVGI